MKKFWIVANILLLIFLIFTIIYGIWIVIPEVEGRALANGQKHVIIMDNLENIPDRMIDSDGFKPVSVFGIIDTTKKSEEIEKEAKEKEKKSEQEQIVLGESKYKIRIALLITGIINNNDILQKVESLPGEINLGYSPYCPDISEHLSKIAAKGHEIYVQIPFEPENYPIDDPGYFGILRNQHNKGNLSRLNSIITKFPSIKGVYSDPKEKFTSYSEELKPILDEIKKDNLVFLYGNGVGNKIFDNLAKERSITVLYKDSLIDQEVNEASIKARLSELETIANEKGFVLAYARPYPLTLSIISDWINSLDKKGISLAPVSQIAK
jgi:polysaccharide deacetylase 2 family uncharacterized protein YibQ